MHTITIPPHLVALREAWREEAQRLDGNIAPLLFHTFKAPPPQQFTRFQAWNQKQLELLESWVKRIETWMNGPLSQTIAGPEISVDAVRARASELGRFGDELVDHRARLRKEAKHPALRGAVPWVDTMFLVLLEQLRDFMRRVVEALDPDALRAAAGSANDRSVELDFRFVPDLSVPMANYLAWLRHAQADLKPHAPAAVRSSHPAPKPGNAVQVIALVLFVLLLALGFLWLGTGLWLVLIAIAVVIFIVRHPIIALIALLFGIS